MRANQEINYTHDGDLFRQLGVWIGGMILVGLLGGILDPIAGPLEIFLSAKRLEWVWLIIMWVYIIGSYIFFVKFLTSYVLPPWRTTLRYIKSFGVTLSKVEAEKIGFLVDGSLGINWYPLDWLNDVEDGDKRRRLFEFANQVAIKHSMKPPFELGN